MATGVDTESGAFFAVCGTIVGWIGFWAFVSKVVRDANRNAPPGSRAKKVLDAINVIQILPLLPLIPIILAWVYFVKKPIEWVIRRGKGQAEVVKLRRAWEANRRAWARSDLETARSEKTALFQVEELSTDRKASATSTIQSLPIVAEAGKSQLESLPPELRIEVYRYLDYGILLRLKSVSRFFWYDKPEENIEREQRATFVYHADTFQHNRKGGRLACYMCLRLRGKNDFSEDRRTGDFKRFGSQETERRCFDCQVANGEVTWTRRLGRRWNRLEAKISNRFRRSSTTAPAG